MSRDDPHGTISAFDGIVEAGDPRLAFLRERWFCAASATTRVLRAPDGAAMAALGTTRRRLGPLAVEEIGGGYWPQRSLPVRPGTDPRALAAALAHELGAVWRLGPVAADDPALSILREAARHGGWQVLTRNLGQLFELDLAALAAAGEWPSAKTQRKNRWRRRRLEEDGGPLRTEVFTGVDWSAAQRDAMATIEAASWLGRLPGGGDTKFRDPARRAYWEALCSDPVLAQRLFGSVLWIGDVPAAFTFGVAAGDTRYYIANNFDERFTQFGPGRVLLYEDFARAAALGVRRVSWGLGDAGYKSEMGAEAGPELLDLLFVRGRLPAKLARLWWER